MVHLSKSNSKLGDIPSVSLPPIITCRPNCPCASLCYATKGRFRFSSNKQIMQSNLEAYQKDPDAYFADIKQQLSGGVITYRYFRWHAAGDFVDIQYLAGVVRLAKEMPQTQFLAFTKKYELVNEWIAMNDGLPDNLNIVFSAWGNMIEVKNPYHLPVAYVRFADNNLNDYIPDSATECNGDCTHCLSCWHINKHESVVFHQH